MASGGSSKQLVEGSRSFDFGSDGVLCSYEDYTPQLDTKANGKRSDPSAKDLHENMVKSPSATVYEQPEELSREDAICAVEKCMEKYEDNLMKHLEGIMGRLTQFELYFYKLERSIGDFRTDMIRDQSEANLKLKSLEKHVHEVHRSVQIIRDKQELSETQTELAKLQLPQKNTNNSSHSQKNSEGLNPATSENKAHNDGNDVSNQQLALTLHQISSPTPSLAITAPDQIHPYKELSLQQSAPVSLSVLPRDHYVLNQVNTCYTHLQPLAQERESQNLQPEIHYAQQRAQMHDFSVQVASKQQPNVVVNQPTLQQPFPQYQQHCSQPTQPQQPSSQAQAPRLQTPAYVPHAPNHPEIYQGSMPLPALYYLQPQNNMQRQPLSQASQGSFVLPPLAKSGYVGISTYPSQSTLQGYNAVYVIDGSRASRLQNFQPGSYPPNDNVAAPLISSNHPFGDVIEKAVSMGHPRDQVISVVRGMAESGHPFDLNLLLDRLNTLTS